MSTKIKPRIKSARGPASARATNNKLCEERKELVNKWFDQWSDEQRKQVLEDLVKKCKGKQLSHLRAIVNKQTPEYGRDFTSVLPRVISLCIFSFLDPRSLSRCSQVSWYWHYLTELDVLWMVKCVRLGWYLTFTPSPHESGLWKRNYIEHIRSLQVLQSPKMKNRVKNLSPRGVRKQGGAGGGGEKGREKEKIPWRGSDPTPTDTVRFNVLDNHHVVEEVNRGRKMKLYGEDVTRLAETVKSKVFTGNNVLRSLSASKLSHTTNSIPDHKRPSSGKKKNHTVQIVSVPRPGPVSPPIKNPRSPNRSPNRSPSRSERDPPSSNLFQKKPWDIPDYNSDN